MHCNAMYCSAVIQVRRTREEEISTAFSYIIIELNNNSSCHVMSYHVISYSLLLVSLALPLLPWTIDPLHLLLLYPFPLSQDLETAR